MARIYNDITETIGNTPLVKLNRVARDHGALPHAHPGIEQVCYLLEGTAHVEVGDEKFEMQPGDACFFPADTFHVFKATSERVKVLVVYAPPYGENPANAVTNR